MDDDSGADGTFAAAAAAAALQAAATTAAAVRTRVSDADPLMQVCGQLQGRRAVVVGLGASGLAMVRWLARHGAQVSVLDDRAQPPNQAVLARELPQVPVLAGRFDAAALDGAELLCWSPGLSPFHGDAAALYQAALAANLAVVGELELFAAALTLRRVDGYAPRIVAITGTNGKTTVTEMVAAFATEAGLDAQAAGNIGPSLLDALSRRIDEGRLPQFWSLELSSFQLAFGEGLDCAASVVLNLSQDHLDWHPDATHYRDCKLAIHRRSACPIVNGDDPMTDPRVATSGAVGASGADLPAASGGAVSGASPLRARAAAHEPGARSARRRRTAAAQAPRIVQFSRSAPAQPGDFGLLPDGGLEWLACACTPADSTRRRQDPPAPVQLRQLMPVDALLVRGAHNQANALAALALGAAAGLALAPMLRALSAFRAAAHRCAPVLTLDGVEYIDDSKGTNVGATVAALQGLGRPAVLIAGGLAKGQDFAPLAAAVRRHAEAVVLIGQDASLLDQALRPTGVALSHAATLQDAVREAAQRAQPGHAVLLSPACASMDMFRNYAHRAQVFVDAVRELAQEAGQPC